MSRPAWILLFLIAACTNDEGGGSGPEVREATLAVDVELFDRSLAVHATEPDRACDCSFGFPRPGECRGQSDGFACTCDPWPASCLEEVVLLAAGEPMARGTWDPTWWGMLLSVDTEGADELVITGCGGSIAIALPVATRPQVSLELESADQPVPVAVWSSQPDAASSIVSLGDGYATQSCHQPGGSGELEVPAGTAYVSVSALAEPAVEETDLGLVRVWAGNREELAVD